VRTLKIKHQMSDSDDSDVNPVLQSRRGQIQRHNGQPGRYCFLEVNWKTFAAVFHIDTGAPGQEDVFEFNIEACSLSDEFDNAFEIITDKREVRDYIKMTLTLYESRPFLFYVEGGVYPDLVYEISMKDDYGGKLKFIGRP
jgi:hypothetical protein